MAHVPTLLFSPSFWTWKFVTVRNSSCGKVMFSKASVIPSTGEGCTPLGQTPPRTDTPRGRHLPGQTPPPGQTPSRQIPQTGRPLPQDGHCSGRYASYWNVFLLLLLTTRKPNEFSTALRCHCHIIFCHVIVVSVVSFTIAWNITNKITEAILNQQK